MVSLPKKWMHLNTPEKIAYQNAKIIKKLSWRVHQSALKINMFESEPRQASTYLEYRATAGTRRTYEVFALGCRARDQWPQPLLDWVSTAGSWLQIGQTFVSDIRLSTVIQGAKCRLKNLYSFCACTMIFEWIFLLWKIQWSMCFYYTVINS